MLDFNYFLYISSESLAGPDEETEERGRIHLSGPVTKKQQNKKTTKTTDQNKQKQTNKQTQILKQQNQ